MCVAAGGGEFQIRKLIFSPLSFIFPFVSQDRSKRGSETVARSWLYTRFGNH